MVGAVFGAIDGIAPGYVASLSWRAQHTHLRPVARGGLLKGR
jgi:hypothetical protein